jgi:hypothetical protein
MSLYRVEVTKKKLLEKPDVRIWLQCCNLNYNTFAVKKINGPNLTTFFNRVAQRKKNFLLFLTLRRLRKLDNARMGQWGKGEQL